MGLGLCCPNCGYVFHGQRTGKCPNCDGGAITKADGLYCISPEQFKRFKEFDKNGGDISALKPPNKHIAVLQVGKSKDWVSLSILGAVVTFNKKLEIIYSNLNNDGYGVDDFPKKIMAEAANQASDLMQ